MRLIIYVNRSLSQSVKLFLAMESWRFSSDSLFNHSYVRWPIDVKCAGAIVMAEKLNIIIAILRRGLKLDFLFITCLVRLFHPTFVSFNIFDVNLLTRQTIRKKEVCLHLCNGRNI